MLSRLRQSFRRKSSRRSRESDGIEDRDAMRDEMRSEAMREPHRDSAARGEVRSDSRRDSHRAHSYRDSNRADSHRGSRGLRSLAAASGGSSISSVHDSVDGSVCSLDDYSRSATLPSRRVGGATGGGATGGGATGGPSPAHPEESVTSAQTSCSQWQRVTPSVVECNRTMFNRQLSCDVTFVVGEGVALVGAHRFVLTSRSDVFYRMFLGPLAETSPVVIPDVTETVFRQFLEFLYCDEVTLTAEAVTPLHYLGRKYCVEPLVQQCLEFLHAQITRDNACSVLEQAHCFDEHELYKTSFEFVTENVTACLASVAVHDLCRSCLESILSLDALEISEERLFQAALNWAEASLEKTSLPLTASNVRWTLGPALHLLRLPTLPLPLLRERVFQTGVLTPVEVKAIAQFKETGQGQDELPFSCRGRQRVLHRFQNVSRVRCSTKPEVRWTSAVTFSCDRDFCLHGIHVFTCTRDASQRVSVSFSVLASQDDVDRYNRCADYDHTYSHSGLNPGVRTMAVAISPPRALLARTHYTLVLQANMAACYAGSDGMAAVTCDDVTFRFRDAPVKLNGTTVSEGQIPCLVYSLR